MISTLLRGIVLGTIGLTYLAVNDVKLFVDAELLPLVALNWLSSHNGYLILGLLSTGVGVLARVSLSELRSSKTTGLALPREMGG